MKKHLILTGLIGLLTISTSGQAADAKSLSPCGNAGISLVSKRLIDQLWSAMPKRSTTKAKLKRLWSTLRASVRARHLWSSDATRIQR